MIVFAKMYSYSIDNAKCFLQECMQFRLQNRNFRDILKRHRENLYKNLFYSSRENTLYEMFIRRIGFLNCENIAQPISFFVSAARNADLDPRNAVDETRARLEEEGLQVRAGHALGERRSQGQPLQGQCMTSEAFSLLCFT